MAVRPAVIISEPVHIRKRPSGPLKPRRRADSVIPLMDRKPPPGQSPAVPSRSTESSGVFGSDLISERSLDEVILAYLAEDGESED